MGGMSRVRAGDTEPVARKLDSGWMMGLWTASAFMKQCVMLRFSAASDLAIDDVQGGCSDDKVWVMKRQVLLTHQDEVHLVGGRHMDTDVLIGHWGHE